MTKSRVDHKLLEIHNQCDDPDLLKKSKRLLCFHCGCVLRRSQIEWETRGVPVAVCPECKVDSLIPETSVNTRNLMKMKKYFFG